MIFKDFKEFALRGNVVDLAIGVIIGAAFGKIVDSVVKDLIMPIVGIFGQVDFSNLYLPLNSKASKDVKDYILSHAGNHPSLEKAREFGPIFAYGSFLTIIINFLILAFIIFLMVKAITRLKRKEADAPALPPEPTSQEKLLMEIRDELKKKNV